MKNLFFNNAISTTDLANKFYSLASVCKTVQSAAVCRVCAHRLQRGATIEQLKIYVADWENRFADSSHCQIIADRLNRLLGEGNIESGKIL